MSGVSGNYITKVFDINLQTKLSYSHKKKFQSYTIKLIKITKHSSKTFIKINMKWSECK